MAHEVPDSQLPPDQRTAQSDDPTLPEKPESEPASPEAPVRPTGVGVMAAILFLLVFVALVIAAILSFVRP